MKRGPSSTSPSPKKKRVDRGPEATGAHLLDGRAVTLKRSGDVAGSVVYWMCRDRRVQDNWALVFAQSLARERKVPLHVCFAVSRLPVQASLRYYDFMFGGLREVEEELRGLGIGFHLVLGEAPSAVPKLMHELGAGELVCDMSPLRHFKKWVGDLQASPKISVMHQVDAHNVVPIWIASQKQEFGARTIRPKIHKLLKQYLTPIPRVTSHSPTTNSKKVVWSSCDKILAEFKENDPKLPKAWTPGSKAGVAKLREFLKRAAKFDSDRNDPTKRAISGMSPYFNHGQVSVQRALLELRACSVPKSAADAFIEEALVRRELSDNFCYYNKDYDAVGGAAEWAQKTIGQHNKDKRNVIYSRAEFEKASTHDPLWNAAQLQLISEAKMHGFMRMYWAKKILEWSASVEDALATAIYLNDRYALDGCDPNGFVGCMWSIVGIHDRAWGPERKVFGKIRYMNYAGCKRKFDVGQFEKQYASQVSKARVASPPRA